MKDSKEETEDKNLVKQREQLYRLIIRWILGCIIIFLIRHGPNLVLSFVISDNAYRG